MIPAAARLSRRVMKWQMLFTLCTGLLVGAMAPVLVLLESPISIRASLALASGVICGGLLGATRNYIRLWRHRWVLRALSLQSAAVEPYELKDLSDEPRRFTWGWAIPTVVALGLATTLWRPHVIDLATGITLLVLGAIIVAAASLLFWVIVRSSVLQAVQLAPPEVMREVVETTEQRGQMRHRIARRLLVATVTPVAFLVLGAAIITSAHLRRADEQNREETARALARATLELGSDAVSSGSLEQALEQAAKLGFVAKLHKTQKPYRVEREQGRIILTTPLDHGGAEVNFSGSTASVINPNSLLIALLALAAAAGCGALLGRLLRRDLQNANVGVRLLGTETVLRGEARVMSPPWLSVVADLGRAIEQLAARFRVFARAQERAIEARERAARMRGLFFASVSHDLKSPLNAILGFTEIVRQTEPITAGQAESLDLIERRGKELLALIETILDAARVEAGQLTLVRDPVHIHELLAEAVETGKNLGGDVQVELISEIAPGVPTLFVDRLRMPRALSTFIGHAVRNASTPVLRLRAGPDGPTRVRIDVEAPSERFSAEQLQAMLDPNRQPGIGQHRGLALGLSVARSIVELHGGKVQVHDHRGGAVFTVVIPVSADFTPAPVA